MAKIIDTDNFGGDYPSESFLNLPPLTQEHAESIAKAINSGFPEDCPRYWRAVPNDYKLQPGFEP